jgi:hypothetical protein
LAKIAKYICYIGSFGEKTEVLVVLPEDGEVNEHNNCSVIFLSCPNPCSGCWWRNRTEPWPAKYLVEFKLDPI